MAATEGLYQSIFATIFAALIVALVWGVLSASLNGNNDHQARRALIGAVWLPVAVALWPRRKRVFLRLRAQPALLLAIAFVCVAALWADGAWRSSFYLASYAAVVFAAVVAGVRWALICAAIAALGYLGGLAVWGYDLDRLRELNDVEWVVADFLSYLVVGAFVALIVNWLGSYVVRINQILGDVESGAAAPQAVPEPAGDDGERVTDRLTVREAEIVHLIAAGQTNDEIAKRLVLSPRTVQRHIANAMRKTSARNRTELAMVAVRDGLVPARGRT